MFAGKFTGITVHRRNSVAGAQISPETEGKESCWRGDSGRTVGVANGGRDRRRSEKNRSAAAFAISPASETKTSREASAGGGNVRRGQRMVAGVAGDALGVEYEAFPSIWRRSRGEGKKTVRPSFSVTGVARRAAEACRRSHRMRVEEREREVGSKTRAQRSFGEEDGWRWTRSSGMRWEKDTVTGGDGLRHACTVPSPIQRYPYPIFYYFSLFLFARKCHGCNSATVEDDSVALDVQENDCRLIGRMDNDRQARIGEFMRELDVAGTISSNNTNSIYRIPLCIRELNPALYEPQILSLGPYHHGKPQFQAMDKLKRCYFKSFLRRNQNLNVEDYFNLVENKEKEARCAYSEQEPPVNFVEMLLLDCCFVLEFLLINTKGWRQGEREREREIINPILNSAWALPLVLRDMLLLENQLPFFLLKSLLEMNIPNRTPSFTQIVLEMFSELMPDKICTPPTDTEGSTVTPQKSIRACYAPKIHPDPRRESRTSGRTTLYLSITPDNRKVQTEIK